MIKGVNPGSPLADMIVDYFEALEARDYGTARVCLMAISMANSNPRIVEELIRQTHERKPT
jgi:hypothetical protein